MAGQGAVFHALAHFEAHGLLAVVLGNGFVNVGGHRQALFNALPAFGDLKSGP
jgi:hypothetical protein